VNANVGDGARGDDPPADEHLSSRSPAAVSGGKASKGRNASRGSAGARDGTARKGRNGARHRPKRDEPQGRQCAARRASRQGGANRRGGARPRGRNTDGKWHSHPEGGRPPGNRQEASGSGLPGEQYDGGAIFGQSQERKLGRPGRQSSAQALAPRGVRERRASGRHPNRSSSRRTGSRRESWREGQEGRANIP